MKYIIVCLVVNLLISCHENPRNTFGGPSDARDTASSRRDTSSVGTRTDGHEQ